MPYSGADNVRFEMRYAGGVNPFEQERQVPGAGARKTSTFARVLGGALLPFSFFFPPAAIGAALAYGASGIAESKARKAEMRAVQNQQGPPPVYFPGLEGGGGGQGAAYSSSGQPMAPVSASDSMVMQVLYHRNEMMMDQTGRY